MTPSQALEIARQYHFWIVLLFLLGWAIHAALQVDAIVRAKNNSISSRTKVVGQNWIRLVARLFVSFIIFMYVWKNPSTLPTILGYFGISLSLNAMAVLTLPMSPWVAGGMGFGVDSALTYIPILKNALPQIEGMQGALLQNASAHIDQAKQEVEQAKVVPPTPTS